VLPPFDEGECGSLISIFAAQPWRAGVATALSLRSHMIGCFYEENADVLKKWSDLMI
jgi:hypothetical protein